VLDVPILEDEIDLAQCLREMLLPKFREVYANVNLASRKFYEDWEKWWAGNAPLAQPQIDLLFVGRDLKLLAAEIKYYRLSENAPLNQPYYSGIEEALALLRFGFTCVSLWHFFDSEVPETVMKKYVSNCWGLTTGLPINYRAFRVYGRKESDFKEISLSSLSEAQPYSLQSPYGTSNPYLSHPDRMKTQDFIRKTLRIPTL
jgi:hypothetical protein